jgi:osmotically inducible protein OsmC
MNEGTARTYRKGRDKQGKCLISSGTGPLMRWPYGLASRFEDDRTGANPEELIAAAHAACLTMAFSFACYNAGVVTAPVNTKANVPCLGREKPSP